MIQVVLEVQKVLGFQKVPETQTQTISYWARKTKHANKINNYNYGKTLIVIIHRYLFMYSPDLPWVRMVLEVLALLHHPK